jgi:hypothetical protein
LEAGNESGCAKAGFAGVFVCFLGAGGGDGGASSCGCGVANAYPGGQATAASVRHTARIRAITVGLRREGSPNVEFLSKRRNNGISSEMVFYRKGKQRTPNRLNLLDFE